MAIVTPPPALQSKLAAWGWSDERDDAFAALAEVGLVPGRVVSSGALRVAITETGPVEVVLQRRFKRSVTSRTELPAVGDWLALEPVSGQPPTAALREILPRTGTFARTRPSDGRPQVIAANLDVAFLVSGLDQDLNLRRIERYLVLARDGGVSPVVVLNKADLATDLEAATAVVKGIAPGTQVLAVSAVTGAGLDDIGAIVGAGVTACLVGSSGVGKSTIANALLGEQRQDVRAIREDDSKGRHTTTRRELFALAGGGLLVDTPGLRTVGVLEDATALAASFSEVEGLATACRFRDCQHEREPGCAVRAGLAEGALSDDRLASYRKLERERRWVELRADERSRREADRRLGRIYRGGRLTSRIKRGEG